MMVPDYAMIAEIMLYSYGYLDARALARKLVQTYRFVDVDVSTTSNRHLAAIPCCLPLRLLKLQGKMQHHREASVQVAYVMTRPLL